MKCTRKKIISKIVKFFDVKNIGKKTKESIFDNPKFNNPPKYLEKKYIIDKLKVSGRNCYTLKAQNLPDTHIVFLHGGAYRYPSTFFHWVLLDNLLKELNCEATFVDYPLAPEHKCKDNVRAVMDIYKYLFKSGNTQKIVLMGDSAGGGLALVMAQIIKKEAITPKPQKIVMLSPWLDISMETEIPEELQECDFMLDRDQLKKNGIEYAGDLSTKDPLCSPYYGDSSDVGEMALFMGTQDILYMDALRFKKKAERENYDLTFYEYKDMQHDWVLFPMDDARKRKRK
jgi:acetyl esterase/lipase